MMSEVCDLGSNKLGLNSSWVRDNLKTQAAKLGSISRDPSRRKKTGKESTYTSLFHLYTFSHLLWWCRRFTEALRGEGAR